MIKMIRDQSVFANLDDDISITGITKLRQLFHYGQKAVSSSRVTDVFFSFLYDEGYLTFENKSSYLKIKIPNKEIKTV